MKLLAVPLLICAAIRLFVATSHSAEPEHLPSFRKQVLTDKYYCDGITAGDINRNGKPDIVAGPFWYEGARARAQGCPASRRR